MDVGSQDRSAGFGNDDMLSWDLYFAFYMIIGIDGSSGFENFVCAACRY